MAYARGLANHPQLDVPAVAEIARVCEEAAIFMDPSDTSASSCDDAFGFEADNESSSCHGFSTTDSEAPQSPAPGPSTPAATFQDILAASRAAAHRLKQPATPPGHPTQEAHHAPPPTADPPQARDPPADTTSPYRTRSGTLRIPQPPKKKGRQEAK